MFNLFCLLILRTKEKLSKQLKVWTSFLFAHWCHCSSLPLNRLHRLAIFETYQHAELAHSSPQFLPYLSVIILTHLNKDRAYA